MEWHKLGRGSSFKKGSNIGSVNKNGSVTQRPERSRRRLGAFAAVFLMLLALVGCGSAENSSEINGDGQAAASGTAVATAQSSSPQIKTSTDKHVAYVKNYVGMNCASVGYQGLDELRHDDYGNGRYVNIVFVTPDGTHLGLDDDSEELRQYKVSAQNVAPNTEINCTFETNSDGEEYDNVVAFQSITEVVLAVDKVGQNGNAKDMTEITPSPDQYTCYVRDYRDRNLADCGYKSLSDQLYDDYGCGCRIKLDISSDDGSYVDPTDVNSLSQYRVTGQSVDPNTQIALTHSTDSKGKEYSNVLDHQSVGSITLQVTHIAS